MGPAGQTPGASKSKTACYLQAPLKRLTQAQYANTIRAVFDGAVEPSSQFPTGEIGASRTGFSTEPDVNVVTKMGAEDVLDSAEDVALAVVQSLPKLLPCGTSDASEACAAAFLQKFGTRLYRRPLTADERAKLLKVFHEAQGAEAFDDGIALMTTAMLQSPEFLYLIERGTPLPSEPRVVQLTHYEVAARLSFLLWDSAPDDVLLAVAAEGKLSTPAELRQQAERMFMDLRARATVSRFAREWLQVSEVKGDDRKAFGDALAQAQQREFQLFVEDAFFNQGNLTTLLTSQESFVDPQLAPVYGMDPATLPAGPSAKQGVRQPERAGILTLPAVMTSKSHSDEPAYVFRGTFVLQKIMCAELASPPATATQMLPAFPPEATQREKSALIRKQPQCGGCHNLIDPIGLSFEAFDEVGRVRKTLPGGQPIDSSGSVEGLSAEADGPFANPRVLSQRLAESPEVQACVARQAFRFAFAKMDTEEDACAVGHLTAAFADKQFSLRELLLGLTQLEGFRFRRLGDAQ